MKSDSPYILGKTFINILLIAAFCFAFSNTNAQNWIWANGEGDIGNDASNGITTDVSGNTYITGNIAGKANFSGTVYQGNGLYECYVAKYDPSGNLLWVKLAGGRGNDQGNSIKWNNGFVYVCGGFEDTAFFGSTPVISKGASDAFWAKYDDNGNLLWVKSAGGTGVDYATGIDVDNTGNIFTSGTYQSAISIGAVNLTTTNVYSESFFTKLDGAGNPIWAKSTTGNNSNLTTGIAFDYNNAVYLTGYFGGSFAVGTGAVNASSASYDIFLAKVNADDGTIDWLKRAGSPYEDGAHGVSCDKDGYPSIVGYFAGTAYFDSNSVSYFDYNDVFVARYDSAGNNLWVRAGRGHQLDIGFAIATDNGGNIVATGMFQDVIDFDGNVLHAYDRDIFLVSYDKSGNIRWITQAGGLDTDCGLAVATNTNGAISISGYYLHTCMFGTIAIDYADGNDLFVANYHPPVVNAVDALNAQLNCAIYPNPCNTFCGLSVSGLDDEASYIVYSEIGERLLKGSVKNYCTVQIAELPAGIYFVEVLSGTKTKTLKLVKQ